MMHACGHDGHASIGLGIAKWLTENGNQLTGKVKIVFQPAEEGMRGGRPVAESGIVDDANYFLGMHLGFIAKSGEIVVNPNNFLCTTKVDFRFYGAPAHAGAEPHLGINALAGACHAATQMLGISRHGKGMSRVNVGVIRAGEDRNVIPSYGELRLKCAGKTKRLIPLWHSRCTALLKVQRTALICGWKVKLWEKASIWLTTRNWSNC